jgi:hypothetical protein
MVQPSNCKLSEDQPHEYSLAHGKRALFVLAATFRIATGLSLGSREPVSRHRGQPMVPRPLVS